MGAELQREIARAVTDRGDDVAMACGDVLAIERRDGRVQGAECGSSAHSVRSAMSFSAGIDDLKRAQFRAALGEADDAAAAARPRPQARPSTSRDPLRWFTVLPPPSLRQSQKHFRHAAELAVRSANALARMQAAREWYEAMLPAAPSRGQEVGGHGGDGSPE